MSHRPLRQSEIERRAVELLKELGLAAPPVDVDFVARARNLQVERVDFGADCAGVLVRKDGRAAIGVNWTDPPVRQRFTVAHEIGHYELHNGETYVDSGSYVVQYRDASSGSGTKNEEREANQFAAALLMPATWVRRAYLDEPFDLAVDDSLRRLAEKFQVSTQAMSYRLGYLGLLRMA
jgi:Zn-dependent peptidase ImmA (M78 family)